jgi:hypothetical protein
MPFNHYARIRDLLQRQSFGWYIKTINLPTSAKKFDGNTKKYDHYYRIYDYNDNPIKYCKFQQLDRLSKILQIPVQDLPIIE